jgi:hypothetical protein
MYVVKRMCCVQDMLNNWTNTNREFQERISETQDTQARLSSHLHLVDKARIRARMYLLYKDDIIK